MESRTDCQQPDQDALRERAEELRRFIERTEPENPRACESKYKELWRIQAVLEGRVPSQRTTTEDVDVSTPLL